MVASLLKNSFWRLRILMKKRKGKKEEKINNNNK